MTQTRVDRFLASPQRVDVGVIGGEAGRHLGTLGNGPVAGDQDIDVAEGPRIFRTRKPLRFSSGREVRHVEQAP